MIETIIAALADFLTRIISETGYIGLALLMAVESACIPLPSEIIMPFAGSLVAGGRFSLFGVATAGAIGCNIGSTVAYTVGAWGGKPAVDRWGRYVLMTAEDLAWSERFFRRFGDATVSIARLLPVVRTFIALPAGIARMPMLRFQAYTFVGSWLWCLVLAYVGQRLGQAWNTDPTLKTLFQRFDLAIVAVVVAAAAIFVWLRLRSLWTRSEVR